MEVNNFDRVTGADYGGMYAPMKTPDCSIYIRFTPTPAVDWLGTMCNFISDCSVTNTDIRSCDEFSLLYRTKFLQEFEF